MWISNKNRKTNFYGAFLKFCLALAVFFGAYQLNAAAQFSGNTPVLSKILAFPAGNYIDYISPIGYLELSSLDTAIPCQIIAHTWDGKVRGRITIPAAQRTGPHVPVGQRIIQSPDGRMLVVATSEGTRLRIMTWRDLHLTGLVTISATLGWPKSTNYNGMNNHLIVMNDGHVIVWNSDPRSFQTHKVAARYCVIKGNLVLSTAMYVSHITMPVINSFGQFMAVDGKRLLITVSDNTRFKIEYLQVALIKNHLAFTSKYVTFTPNVCSSLVYGDRLLSSDGAIYDATGQIGTPNKWFCNDVYDGSTNQRFFAQFNKGRIRVFDVQTQSSWDVKPDLPEEYMLATNAISPDGRYLAIFRPLTDINAAENKKKTQVFPNQNLQELCLYERPSTLRARLQLPVEPVGFVNSSTPRGTHLAISPDGRYVIVPVYESDDTWRYYLYAW